MTDTATATTPAEMIRNAATALGLTMSAVFVPFSLSRNAVAKDGQEKPWRSLNWRVTLERNGRPFITTDYSAGEGNAPSYNAKMPRAYQYGNEKRFRADAIAWEIENGFAARVSFGGGFIAADRKKPLMPSIEDVLSSLVLDSSVLDSAGFEDWASDLGYDPDSRTAETIYRACLETALKLRAAIGEAGIEALRIAGEDY
jgi:hypothetical protein